MMKMTFQIVEAALPILVEEAVKNLDTEAALKKIDIIIEWANKTVNESLGIKD